MLPRVNIVRTDQADYLLFSTRDALTAKIYDTGEWARFERGVSKGYCEGLESPLVLDIGANLGFYSVPLARELKAMHGFVYAYEPQRIAFYQLCGNAVLNRLDNLFAFPYAIGAKADWISLPDVDYAASVNTSGLSVDPSIRDRVGSVVETASSYPVEIRPLDDLKLPKAPALIKIDAEGLEFDIIEGGQRLLRDSRFPLLILEAWRDEWMAEKRARLLNLLDSIGYRCLSYGDDIIASHSDNPVKFEFSLTEDNKLRMRRGG